MSDVDPTQEGPPPPPPPTGGSSFTVPPQVDAWLTDRSGAAALALVFGTACFVFAATVNALGAQHYIKDEWKYRAQVLANPSVLAASLLVLAAVLLYAGGTTRADIRKIAATGVVVLALLGVLAMLFGMISDLASLGDSFNAAVADGLRHLGGLVLCLVAAAMSLGQMRSG